MKDRKNIMQRGNLVVFSFAGTYHIGWVIGQERDGTYAIYDENHTIRKHVFANHPHSNFTVNQKLTKKIIPKITDRAHVNMNIPDIADILHDDTIEGWSLTQTGIDYSVDTKSVDDENDIVYDDIDIDIDANNDDYGMNENE